MSYNNENPVNPNADVGSNNPISASTPVGVPDILAIGQPLDRQVDIEIETNLLDPVSHNYVSANGGTSTWVFPAKGVLDNRNAAIVFELNASADGEIGFPAHGGALACIERATVRCGGTVLSQVDHCALYAQLKSNFKYSPDEKVGILDVRQYGANNLANRIAPATLATGSGDASFHQLYNPDYDQVDSYGRAYNAGAANSHVQPITKQLTTVAGTGPQAVIRLRDLFEFFDQPNRLPLFAMAQVELVIEWGSAGDAAVAAANITDSIVVQTNTGIAAPADRTNQQILSMVTPVLMLDYIIFGEQERNQIQAQIDSPNGLVMSFMETIRTNGINPQASAATLAAAANTTEAIASQHILGMAGKEVHSILVAKQYDIKSGQGLTEIDSIINGVSTHRNILTNQFKSQSILGEKYNWIINNDRIYSSDVENVAVQHNYLSQIGGNYNVPQPYYQTCNYNGSQCRTLLDTSWNNQIATADPATGGANGRTQRYMAGSSHVIGLCLQKMPKLGPLPGNGQRISTAPIEFHYQRLALRMNGAADDMTGAVNLTFYINYRKTLVIQSNGITVSDA